MSDTRRQRVGPSSLGRWETSEFGSPSIETEHLLLGILKADLALASKYLAIDHPYTSVRAEVERASPRRPPKSTSVDLPLSHEAQRALSYAEEEAQRLNQRQIDTEHLLLGLLREKTTFAAKLLKDHGVTLSEARQSIAKGQVTLEASEAQRSKSTVPARFVAEDGVELPIRLPHPNWIPRTGDYVRLETAEGSIAYRVLRVEWQIAVAGSDGSPLQQLEVTLRPEPATGHE